MVKFYIYKELGWCYFHNNVKHQVSDEEVEIFQPNRGYSERNLLSNYLNNMFREIDNPSDRFKKILEYYREHQSEIFIKDTREFPYIENGSEVRYKFTLLKQGDKIISLLAFKNGEFFKSANIPVGRDFWIKVAREHFGVDLNNE